MNILTHITLTTLLLLTTCPLYAEDKAIEQAKDKVTVKKDISKKEVYVSGSVQRPGPVEYKEGTTIYAMIMAAGGPTELGTLKRVTVTRKGKAFRLDLTKKEPKGKMLAESDDMIEVASTWMPHG